MKKLIETLTYTTQSIDLPIDQREKYISLLLGYAIGSQIDLPSAAPTNPKLYYVNNLSGLVRATVADINEQFILDIAVVLDIVERIWTMRLRLVHPTPLSLSGNWSMLPLADNPTMPSAFKDVLCQIKDASEALNTTAAGIYVGVAEVLGKAGAEC